MSADLTHPSPNHSARRGPVEAVCVHWTGGTYASAVDWVCRPESVVSYHAIIGPTGDVAYCVPWDRAAWAVGASRQPDDARFTFGARGNGATDNIALAGGPKTPPTAQQITMLLRQIRARFVARGWPMTDTWRILGHVDVAVYPAGHPKAGQRGRKPDPTGQGWLNLDTIRQEIAA